MITVCYVSKGEYKSVDGEWIEEGDYIIIGGDKSAHLTKEVLCYETEEVVSVRLHPLDSVDEDIHTKDELNTWVQTTQRVHKSFIEADGGDLE
jgi:hypothetical protein